jgi:hypothetical protein
LEALHCFGAGFALLFDLVLNLIEQRIELTVSTNSRAMALIMSSLSRE